MLRDRSLWIWRAAIFGATVVLVGISFVLIAFSALKTPARASTKGASSKPGFAAAALAAARSAAAYTPPPPPSPSPAPAAAPATAAPGGPPPAPAPAPPPAPPAPAAPRTDAAGTVWLCRPGLAANPCAGDLDATAVFANGTRAPISAQPATNSRFDCFYLYPTVSTQNAPNANLNVDPSETSIAVEQAARFSQVCQVWAPIYRQRTQDFPETDPNADADVAYGSLVSAWNDYMAHFNNGRPIIIVGHSQGAIMLARLIGSVIDPNPAVRRLVVSAIIPGSNTGGFPGMPACHSGSETGCIIAFSSYYEEPPGDAVFGRLGGMCVNPANLGGGPGAVVPYQRVNNAWVSYPGLYTASCVSADGATWLQVNAAPGDRRPRIPENLGPAWGLHQFEVDLTLGNLVQDVAVEESAYGG